MKRYVMSSLLATLGAGLWADDGPSLPNGDVVGTFVSDSGYAIVGVTPVESWDRMTVLSWRRGGEVVPQDLDIAGKSMSLLHDDKLLIYGHRMVEGRGGLAYRVYRVRANGKLQLESEFDTDGFPAWKEEAWVEVSPDGEVWVAMANLREDGKSTTSGRHFAFGDLGSGRVRGKLALEYYPAAARLDDVTAFLILESSGPTVLASYAADLFVIRFGDGGGVLSRPVDQLRWVVRPRGGALDVVWQFHERVLWARRGSEWHAYDLWNVGYSLDFPQEPSATQPAEAGRPHPIRGFVEIERNGSRHRVKHSWQSLRFPDWREEHVSEWRSGALPVAVSPSGRHALVLEKGRTDERAYGTYMRSYALDRANVRPPVEAAFPDRQEKQADPRSKPGQ